MMTPTRHDTRAGFCARRIGAACSGLLLFILATPLSSQSFRIDPATGDGAAAKVSLDDSEKVAHRIVICGHLYSLYSRNKLQDPNELIYSERYLRTFATELTKLAPDATFFLGDSTRYSKRAEWDLLGRVFKSVPGEKVWVAGNHEVKDFKAFEDFGGVHNASYVIGRNKFVTLDSKTVFGAEDLAFIAREMEDAEDYDNVFIMMHLFLFGNEEIKPGTDPYEAYDVGTNWETDVVPLIAGKVSYIFMGDYFPGQVGRFVQRYKEHELHYIRNAFLFRRGRGNEITGDGPMMYLVLEINEAGAFSLVPKLLPVDLKDTWYRYFGLNSEAPAYEDYEEQNEITPEWRRVPVRQKLSVGFPRSWRVTLGQGEELYTAWQYRNELGIRAKMYEYSNAKDWTPEEYRAALIAQVETNRGEPLQIEREGRFDLVDGPTVNWTISESFTAEASSLSLNCYFLHEKRAYLVVYSTDEVLPDYRAKLEALLMMFQLSQQHRFKPKK